MAEQATNNDMIVTGKYDDDIISSTTVDVTEQAEHPTNAMDEARQLRDMRWEVESRMLMAREIKEELIAAIEDISVEVIHLY